MLFYRLLDVAENMLRRKELATGNLAVVMANSLAPKKQGRWTITDFVPWERQEETAEGGQTIEQQRKMVRALRAVFGDKRDRKGGKDGRATGL